MTLLEVLGKFVLAVVQLAATCALAMVVVLAYVALGLVPFWLCASVLSWVGVPSVLASFVAVCFVIGFAVTIAEWSERA